MVGSATLNQRPFYIQNKSFDNICNYYTVPNSINTILFMDLTANEQFILRKSVSKKQVDIRRG